MTQHPRTKTCEHCGKDFHRPPNGMMHSVWQAKRHCNLDCKVAATEARLSGAAKPRPYSAASELNAELGSAELLSRTLTYYRGYARQNRLNNIWEAAVLLGMAA